MKNILINLFGNDFSSVLINSIFILMVLIILVSIFLDINFNVNYSIILTSLYYLNFIINRVVFNYFYVITLIIPIYLFYKYTNKKVSFFFTRTMMLIAFFTFNLKLSQFIVVAILTTWKITLHGSYDIYSDITLLLIIILLYNKSKILLNIILVNIITYKKYGKWLIYLLTSMLMFYNYLAIYSVINENSTIYFLASSIVFIFIIIGIYISTILLKNIRLEMKNKLEIEKLNQQKKYIESLEKNNKEIRKFKHDFNNILLSLNGYINNNDFNITELREYFNNNILPINNKLATNSSTLANLDSIKVKSLKSLLTNKILTAQTKDINISVSIENIIDDLFIDEMQISRVLGILLDNAIEGCLETKDKKMSIIILRIDKTIDIRISNTFNSNNNNISIKQFNEEGFSTKGENRGLGLSTAHEIVDRYNMILNTFIEDDNFIQYLTIEGGLL